MDENGNAGNRFKSVGLIQKLEDMRVSSFFSCLVNAPAFSHIGVNFVSVMQNALRWPQKGRKIFQDGFEKLRDPPKMNPRRPKMASRSPGFLPNEPKRPQDDFRRFMDDPDMAAEAPAMARDGPKDCP